MIIAYSNSIVAVSGKSNVSRRSEHRPGPSFHRGVSGSESRQESSSAGHGTLRSNVSTAGDGAQDYNLVKEASFIIGLAFAI